MPAPRLPAAALRLLLRLAAGCLLGLLAAPVQAQNGGLELAVKATYLYKIADFVDWPEAMQDRSAPLLLCTLGRDPLIDVAEQVALERPAQRAIRFLRVQNGAPLSGCHILYAGGSAAAVAAALERARGLPVLTVTDAERNGGPKGIIDFVIAGNRVRFDIRNGVAAEAGLKISSKLLSLALRVTPPL